MSSESREGPDLIGRVIIVTGAGQGIGRGVALCLAGCGASIVVAERNDTKMEETVTKLSGLGHTAIGVKCDVGDRESIHAMVARTMEQFGRIDALVNNAQSFRAKAPVAEIAEEDFDVMLKTGPKGTLWAMQAVYPHMRDAAWGRIVNFASAAGITGAAGYGAYNATKEAIRALTRTAAREWGRDGIVVNAIAPAAASPRGLAAMQRDEEAFLQFEREHPIGRMGDPETDTGPVVAFLCSPGARYLTGQTLMVDGGGHLWA